MVPSETSIGNEYFTVIFTHYENIKEAEEDYFAWNEIEEWNRWCWQFNEYTFTMKQISRVVRLIHRRLCISLSGWLARAGKKKKDGK